MKRELQPCFLQAHLIGSPFSAARYAIPPFGGSLLSIGNARDTF
jgi:hypothetical protein